MRYHRLRSILAVLFMAVLMPAMLTAQRGTITIPIGASISIPLGAEICADTIFANGAGHGRLNIANPSCLCSGIVITPVELLMLSAMLQNGIVQLTWGTATESHNYGFELQRRTSTENWTPIAFIQGHGSTMAPQAYQYADRLDDLPRSTTMLRYRLRQIDFNGHSDFSPEVEIHLDRPLPRFQLVGYPSPCDQSYTLHMTMSETAALNIRLHDVTGRVVMPITQNAVLPAGSHIMRVYTADLPSGLYLLVVDHADGRRTEKVTIRH